MGAARTTARTARMTTTQRRMPPFSALAAARARPGEPARRADRLGQPLMRDVARRRVLFEVGLLAAQPPETAVDVSEAGLQLARR